MIRVKTVKREDFQIKTKSKTESKKEFSPDTKHTWEVNKRTRFMLQRNKIRSEELPPVIFKTKSPNKALPILKKPKVQLKIEEPKERRDNSPSNFDASFMMVDIDKSRDYDNREEIINEIFLPGEGSKNLLKLISKNTKSGDKNLRNFNKHANILRIRPKKNPFSVISGKLGSDYFSTKTMPQTDYETFRNVTTPKNAKMSHIALNAIQTQNIRDISKLDSDSLDNVLLNYEKLRLTRIKNKDKPIVKKSSIQFAIPPNDDKSRASTPRSAFFKDKKGGSESSSDISESEEHEEIKININDSAHNSGGARRLTLAPKRNSAYSKAFKTDKVIPRLTIPGNNFYGYTLEKRDWDASDTESKLDQELLSNRTNSVNISNVRERSKSILQKGDGYDNEFQHCKSAGLFLRTPKSQYDPINDDVSVKSIESNVFKRGLNMMQSRRKKSLLFEMSSRATVIDESEHGEQQINQYKILNTIGKGAFSVIKLALNTDDKIYYAMKIVNVTKMKRIMMSKQTTGVDSLESEISIMKKLDPAYCVKLQEVIGNEADEMVYIAMQYMKRGPLTGIMKCWKLLDDDIWKYFRQLILALQYLHEKLNVIHRDIKPDNMLIDDKGDLKLADFGISKEIIGEQGDILKDTAGSNYYMSPEWCKGEGYSGKSADIWACGVTLYQLTHDKYPFIGQTHVALNDSIMNSEPNYDRSLDSDLVTLLQGILWKDPKRRYTFKEIRLNPWFTKKGSQPLENVKE